MWAAQHECWELNTGHLAKQEALLTTESSLQIPQFSFLKKRMDRNEKLKKKQTNTEIKAENQHLESNKKDQKKRVKNINKY